MDLEVIFDELSDDEKVYFISSRNVDYYKYIINQVEFRDICTKLDQDIDLDNTEWKYMLEKLFLITDKSMLEEDNISFRDKIIYSFSKFCIKKIDDSTDLYSECYKIVKYFDGLNEINELNDILVDGLLFVFKNRNNNNLKVLLEQHDMVQACREYREDFIERYMDDIPGRISGIQYRDINLLERSYNDVKGKVLSYKKQ